MCELCAPALTRRSALTLAGSAALAALAMSPPRPALAARRHQTGFGVDILPRATWAGSDLPFRGTPESEDVRFLLVHHTAGPSNGDPIEIMRGIYAFHTGPDRGWPDVAYNFFIEPGGTVYEGRAGSLDDAVRASATGGSQGFAQLVCVLGDFTAQNPTPAALGSLNATLAWLADRYGLDTSPGTTATFTSRGSNRWPAGTDVTANVVSGHRDMSLTACPGDTFYPYLVANVQREVHALRGDVEPAPTTTSAPTVSTAAPAPETPATTTGVAGSVDEPRVGDSIATVPPSTVSPSTVPPSTVRATGAVGSAPTPAPPSEETAAVAGDTGSRSSANGSAIAVGVAGLAVLGGAAAYIGIRGRHDDTSLPPDSPGAGG